MGSQAGKEGKGDMSKDPQSRNGYSDLKKYYVLIDDNQIRPFKEKEASSRNSRGQGGENEEIPIKRSKHKTGVIKNEDTKGDEKKRAVLTPKSIWAGGELGETCESDRGSCAD